MYTKQDIKDWFFYMMKKYQNCQFNETLRTIQDTMFNEDYGKEDTLDYFIHYIKKGEQL